MKTFVILINLLYIFTFPLNAQVNNTNCNVKQVSDPFNGKIYLISEYETIYTYTPNIHGLYDYYSAFVYKDSSYYFRLAVKTEQGDIWVAYLTGVQIKFDDDAVLDLKDPTKNTEIIKKKGWEYVEFKLTDDDLKKLSGAKILQMRLLTHGTSIDYKIQKKEVALDQCNCILNFQK